VQFSQDDVAFWEQVNQEAVKFAGPVCGARLRQNKTLLSANQIGQTNTVIVVTSF
jgi:hypothetical protein